MPLSLTGGRFKGSSLKTPAGKSLTRPTSGKVRQALFNVLRNRFECGNFLDLYAGSGAVGLEALSRGYRLAVLVESHPAAYRILRENCQVILNRGAERISLEWIRQDVTAFCRQAAREGRRFETVFADPPFDLDFSGLWKKVQPLLKEGGIAVIQFPTRNPPGWITSAARVMKYGESSLALLEASDSGAGC